VLLWRQVAKAKKAVTRYGTTTKAAPLGGCCTALQSMNFSTLIHRSLRFHSRSHVGVILGAAIGSAALIGALIIGDSVRGSLHNAALNRLGSIAVALDAKDRFLRENIASEMATNAAVPVLRVRGSVNRSDGEARANQVQVLGIDERFATLAGQDEPQIQKLLAEVKSDSAWLNASLARQLKASVGDALLLRIGKPTSLAADAAITPKNDSSIAIRLTVAGVWPDDAPLGNFALQPFLPFNLFIPLDRLQEALGKEDRVNLVLSAGGESTGMDKALETHWQLADAEMRLTNYPSGVVELRSPRVFLDPPIVHATRAADTRTQPILTYLANSLASGTNLTPYSMITAADAPWTPEGMAEDEILVTQWLVDDLQVGPGSTVTITYFDPESGADLLEKTNTFRVRSIVSAEMPWADRTLMPDFPGIEKAESTSDWDAGFPLVHKIRNKDEDYWKQHRGTPKAFVTLIAGKKMWGNRFGDITAVRFQPGNVSSLEGKILSNLKPSQLGLRFEPVREMAFKAASQSQDFGGLFIGFSFFLIIAALLLMAMLFQFGLEQRIEEVGTFLALGFSPKQVRRLLLGEGVALAFIGGVLGTVGGIFYARAMLHGLSTIWRDAIGAMALGFHVTMQTVIIGLLSSVILSSIVVWMMMRKLVRRPARELLAGEVQGPSYFAKATKDGKSKPQGRGRIIGAISFLGGIGLVGWSLAKGDTANAGAFFGAGALMLIAGLNFTSAWLSRRTGVAPVSNPTLGSLALRGCARRRSRSISTVAMLACGSFLIASIGVFRLDANRDATQRTSGTGGFALIGETTLPVIQDLNTASGRDFFALNERDLQGVNVVPFRLQEGDEASCLNLNAAQRPRLLGVDSSMLSGRFTFAKHLDQAASVKTGPWSALEDYHLSTPLEKDEIPAIGDANSIQWAMKKKIGDAIDYVDDQGQPFKVRIVGAVANSILQGSLIIDEGEFIKRFPGNSGYKMFLIDAPSNSMAQVSTVLSRALQNVGLELTPAAERLNQFNAVQNTYLGTFQVLGGLGLLLGSVGLGVVVLRNVLERRGELAVLQAVGFRKPLLQRMLLLEHGALLMVGLGIGVVAAGVAVLPSMFSPSAQLPYQSLTLTLGLVLLNGLLWTWVATQVALRGNLLKALRNE
jgi:putative ABC transport system permease protein